MPEIVSNKEDFLVLKMSQKEATYLGWGFNGECVCMRCNDIIKDDIYYIAVLNDVMDRDCYEQWLDSAIHYGSDKRIEKINFNRVLRLLKND